MSGTPDGASESRHSGKQSGERERTIYLDRRLQAYESFYDHTWAKRFSELTRGTVLDQPAFDLCVNWKAAANTHRTPWILVHSLEWQLNGYARDDPTRIGAIVGELERRLLVEIGADLPGQARKKLTRAVRKLSDNAIQARTQAHREMSAQMSAEAHWSALMGETEFGLSIWGAQRLCYGAVYHAYENFVRQCVAIIVGKSPDWRPGAELVQLAQQALGSTVVSQCFSSIEITVARHVRNALAHHGGRITKELEGIRHNIQVIDGTLQISAPDTRNLFDQLKEPAFSLGQATLGATAKAGAPDQG